MAKKRIVVFSPHPDDAEYGAWGFLHQNRDEEITIVFVSGAVDRLHEATNAIFELGSKIIGLGEIDGSLKPTPSTDLSFAPNVFVPLTRSDRKERAKALIQHETQKHQDYFSESHLEAKDRFWGYRIGVEFAEPFFAYKIIL